MREEHRREEHRREERRGPRGEGRGPGGPEWGPRPGRGGGRYGGEREFRGGPGWGGPGGPGGPGWGRRRGAGAPPFGPPGVPFGPEGPFGPGDPFERRRFGRGSRARKGDVRAAILDLFAEDESRTWNGYQLIQEIPARTDGAWRPSAGSVYPALQLLEDQGLIAPQGTGRRRVYTLTDQGRAYVEAHADELRSSWDAAASWTDEDSIEFRNLIRQVLLATQEVRRAGSAEQVAQARAVLAQARKALYLILAEDGAAEDAPAPEDAPEDVADEGPQDTQ